MFLFFYPQEQLSNMPKPSLSPFVRASTTSHVVSWNPPRFPLFDE